MVARNRKQQERSVLATLIRNEFAYRELPQGFNVNAFKRYDYRRFYEHLMSSYIIEGRPANVIDFHSTHPDMEGILIDILDGESLNGELTIRAAELMGNLSSISSEKELGLEYALTDTGNAERLKDEFGDIIRYDHTKGRWMIWNGKYWKEDDQQYIIELAKKTVRKIYADAVSVESRDERDRLAHHALRSESAKSLQNMIHLAESAEGIATTAIIWDNNPHLFNCCNGTYDLVNDIIRENRKSDYLTFTSGVEYDAEAISPHWTSFLNKILSSNVELIRFVQMAVGYSLAGDTSEQCLFFLYGRGMNGKSVFVETLKILFGDYAQKAPSEMLMVKSGESISNDVARLLGMRLVIASEVAEGRKLNESKVKDLTGGDTITARQLYREYFEFKPSHKVWLVGNHKPVIMGSDDGIWRRIKLIPFTETIPESDRRPMSELLEEFISELPGIFNWALEGYRLYKEKGLTEPEEVVKASDEYRNEMDVLNTFLEECCVKKSSSTLTNKEFYGAYTRWCEESSERPLTNRQFVTRLKEREFELKPGRGNVRIWCDIELREEFESPFG